MSVLTKKTSGVNWVTRKEAEATVESHARRVLGISAKKFISNWRAGKYRALDSDDCPGIIELALIAHLPRRTSGRKKRTRGR